MGCSRLTSITIPNSVISIGNYSFSGCSGLTSVAVPNGVKDIGEYAFQNCTSLNSIIFPSSISEIGDYAFKGCKNILSVSIKKEKPIRLSYGVFSNPRNATLYVPKGCKEAYEEAVHWNDFKEIVETDYSETSINQIKDDYYTRAEFYTIDGKLKDNPKGLSIIRTKDGKSRKVVVK